MKTAERLFVIAAASAGLAGLAFAQSLISAKSGLIHYTEGRVLLNGKPAELKFGIFPQMNENSELRTEEGRAEVLLTPGVFLRLAENSSARMISNQLSDTRLEVLSGSALVECAELLKNNSITLAYKDATVNLRKHGMYRLDTEPAMMRVYEGEAEVTQGGQHLVLKKGKMAPLNGLLMAEKFNAKVGDALLRWSGRRSEYLAMANISAAKSLRDSGIRWSASSWAWNPYFGMFTFVPLNGVYNSFFGYSYWSPRAVYSVYRPVRAPMAGGWSAAEGGGNHRYSTISRTSSGSSGTMAVSAAPTSAGAARSAPVSRGSGQAGGRSR